MRLGQEGYRPTLLGPEERRGSGKGPIMKSLTSQIKIWVSILRWYDLEKVSNQEHHVVKLVSMKRSLAVRSKRGMKAGTLCGGWWNVPGEG